MKRVWVCLLCLIVLLAFCGCVRETGYWSYTGIYVKTSQGEHVLIHNASGKQEYFVLNPAEGCRSLDQLQTGDQITIKVPCVSYDEAELSERTVYKWERKLLGRTDVPQATLDFIENLFQ